MERLSSPLESWHRQAGAKMVDFHGWQMPLHYSARVSEEVAATRQRVGLFDLCHMGRIQLRGADRVAFADLVYTNSVETMQEGEITYGFLCNEAGGVIDDITLYRSDDYLMLVVNAANRAAVLQWLNAHRAGFDVQIEDKTAALGMCAVQGPAAFDVMAQMASQRLDDLPRYHFRLVRLRGHLTLLSRTGYTGEDGFELYFGRAHALEIWQALVVAAQAVGGAPVGLAARDTLRLEAGLPLHGQELTPQITPVEAGLERFVRFEKRHFLGRQHLLDTTNSEAAVRLVAFEMLGRAIPRTGHAICHRETSCGRVTSGGWSPTLDKAIGMGYVEQGLSPVGQHLQIRVRDKYHPAVVVKRPFYRRPKRTP